MTSRWSTEKRAVVEAAREIAARGLVAEKIRYLNDGPSSASLAAFVSYFTPMQHSAGANRLARGSGQDGHFGHGCNAGKGLATEPHGRNAVELL